MQNLDLTENYFDKTQSQQLYKVVEDHNRQANLNKMATNAVLFYWDGLKSQKYKATTIFTVGSLPEDVIMEILRCLGYIHCTLSSNNKVKFVRKLLNLKI